MGTDATLHDPGSGAAGQLACTSRQVERDEFAVDITLTFPGVYEMRMAVALVRSRLHQTVCSIRLQILS